MTGEDMKDLAKNFLAGQDRNKGGPPEGVCAPGYTVHIGGFPAMNLAGHSELAEAFYSAFPDLSHRIDDVIGEGDKTTVRFTLSGTHRGEFMGVAATGRSVSVSGLALFRLEDGKVAELWEEFNPQGLMEQLTGQPA